MKVTGNWLNDPWIKRAFSIIGGGGFQIFAVGGCVRNALWNAPVNDVDLTTDARPEDVLALAADAGVKAVPTGIEHGTVTLVIDGHGIEVTTFRRDVETDGRHAVVAFSDNAEDDAMRRDFTINAIYCDARGEIFDPLGGLEDIAAHRIRFIGDAEARIREDALRILRFFRFFAWYARPDDGIDAEGLAASAAHLDMLDRLSDERIGAEMRKLLAAPDPSRAIATMAQSGVLSRVMPGAVSEALPVLIDIEPPFPAAWIRRLAVLGGEATSGRLKLTNKDRKHLKAIDTINSGGLGPKIGAYRYGVDASVDAALVLAASLQQPASDLLKATAEDGAAQVFPVKANMLIPPFEPGPQLGLALKQLEDHWIKSDFTAPKEDLIALALP